MNSTQELTTDMIIQYSIVGVILLAACVWMLLKVFRKNKKASNSCCGCAIAGSCQKVNRERSPSSFKDKKGSEDVEVSCNEIKNRDGNDKDI